MVKPMTPISNKIAPMQGTTYSELIRAGRILGAPIKLAGALPQAHMLRCPHCGAKTDARGVSMDGGATWQWVCAVDHACPVAAKRALAESEREAQEEAARAMERAGIPPEYRGLSADDLASCPQVQSYIADRQYRDNGGGAYIYSAGVAGTGKTTAGMVVAGQCVRDGRTAMVASEPAIIARLQAAMSREGENVLDVISRLMAIWMLVVDDLGKAKVSDWQLSQLFLLVDERVKARRPTVYTTQYTLDELERRWAAANPVTAEAICSRIQGTAVPIKMSGPDMRRA